MHTCEWLVVGESEIFADEPGGAKCRGEKRAADFMCIQLHACIVYRDEEQGMRVGANMKRWIRDDRQVHRIALNPQI
jgi:hypothetical protein